MLNLKRLQYLDAVYQYKNFTQASEALYVSQPAISSAVQALEEELGVRLVVRSSKGVTFTYEGEQFMIWARRILSTCEAAENAMRDLAGTAEQRLRLGISHVLTNPIVPMIFSTFLREHPKAQIYLNEGSMNKHVEMVTGEMLDLAYNAFPTAPEAEELEIIPMGTMEIHAVLHPDHPLARLDRIPLARLGEEKLIMMDAQSKVKELMSREFERHQVIPDILFNYDQVLCMANLVRSCRYVGIISVAQGQQALRGAGGVRRGVLSQKGALSAQAGVGADSLHPGEHPAGRHLTAGTPFQNIMAKKRAARRAASFFATQLHRRNL